MPEVQPSSKSQVLSVVPSELPQATGDQLKSLLTAVLSRDGQQWTDQAEVHGKDTVFPLLVSDSHFLSHEKVTQGTFTHTPDKQHLLAREREGGTSGSELPEA